MYLKIFSRGICSFEKTYKQPDFYYNHTSRAAMVRSQGIFIKSPFYVTYLKKIKHPQTKTVGPPLCRGPGNLSPLSPLSSGQHTPILHISYVFSRFRHSNQYNFKYEKYLKDSPLVYRG